MNELAAHGKYTVRPETAQKIAAEFACGFCDDKGTKQTIAKLFSKKNYLLDTHTAVAWNVAESYRETSGAKNPLVVVSTASPFKFCQSVLEALGETEFAERTSSRSSQKKPERQRPHRWQVLRERPFALPV